MATQRSICISTKKSTRWLCNWVGAIRWTWLFAPEWGEARGYDEINLNCGCPSERVLKGAFGACLMGEAQLVADGVKAMVDVVDIPVTVKHRIGIDKIESYDFVRDFVGTVSEAGCQVFLVHARNAWLQGLSPKENREIPPLRYDLVHQLKRDFPHLVIAVNGGIKTNAQIAEQLAHVDGAMIGREAYHNPWLMTSWDETFYGEPSRAEPLTREAVELAMVDYMERAAADDGAPWYSIASHMLGLRHGEHGARKWRQVWSDHKLKPLPPREVWAMAQAHVGHAELEMPNLTALEWAWGTMPCVVNLARFSSQPNPLNMKRFALSLTVCATAMLDRSSHGPGRYLDRRRQGGRRCGHFDRSGVPRCERRHGRQSDGRRYGQGALQRHLPRWQGI